MKKMARWLLCFMISFTLSHLPIMQSAHAGRMITTSQAVAEMTRVESAQKVSEFLDRKDVQEQMVKLGVTPQEAQERLAHLSDAELRKVAGDIDQSTIGGDVGGILVLVLLILLIIYFAKRI